MAHCKLKVKSKKIFRLKQKIHPFLKTPCPFQGGHVNRMTGLWLVFGGVGSTFEVNTKH